jgi:protein-S-isoprenylcysteine O-methyltransferase Ste14
MSLLFPSLFDEFLFWVVILGGFGEHVWVVWKAGGLRQTVVKKDRGEPRLAPLAALLFMLPIPIAVGYARIGVLPSYLLYPGLVVWIAGLAITSWGVLVLGGFVSGFARVVSGHHVIQEGPYRLIRHPIYAGEILGWIGLGLALQSWVALLLILVASAIHYSNLIRVEERFLAVELGDTYVQYTKRTKRIVPFIL